MTQSSDGSGVTAAATRCRSRTRLYRHGVLEREDFPVAEISDLIVEDDVTVWLDLLAPQPADLEVITEEFGLHPLAVEDALHEHQRPKLDRYRSHLFLNVYAIHLDPLTGQLTVSELAAFVTKRALITIRKDERMDMRRVVERWDENPDLARFGVGYLVHGLLDYVVDGHFEAVQVLDDAVEDLEDELFTETSHGTEVQRRSFQLRKSLVLARRVVLPTRELVNTLMRRDLGVVDEHMQPYFADVYDHVLRATDWLDSLRDLVATILETRLTLQGNQLNEIMKKLTAWAAIIAVPTAVTGFYGQNVPYPGFQKESGLVSSVVLILAIAGTLYVVFRRKGWL